MKRAALALLVLAVLAAGCRRSHVPGVVFDGKSAVNGRILIFESGGERELRFSPDGARQSLIRVGAPLELLLPYTRTAMVSLALVPKPARVLIVGVGGGAMPMFLRALDRDTQIDGVDIDPEVIAAAREHLGFKTDARLHAIVADGRAFTASASAGYDLIFLDAYNDEAPPRHLSTVEFLRLARSKLAGSGLAVGNVWGSARNTHYPDMLRTWEEAFGKVCVLLVPDSENVIFLGEAGGELPADAALVTGVNALTAAHPLPFNLAEHARAGCQPHVSGGTVLHDAIVP